jgi:hypothetical protein
MGELVSIAGRGERRGLHNGPSSSKEPGLADLGVTKKQLSADRRREVLHCCRQLRLRIAERKCNVGGEEVAALERGERELVALVGLLVGPPPWYSSTMIEA